MVIFVVSCCCACVCGSVVVFVEGVLPVLCVLVYFVVVALTRKGRDWWDLGCGGGCLRLRDVWLGGKGLRVVMCCVDGCSFSMSCRRKSGLVL